MKGCVQRSNTATVIRNYQGGGWAGVASWIIPMHDSQEDSYGGISVFSRYEGGALELDFTEGVLLRKISALY